MHTVVPKPWGVEWLAFDNGQAAVTVLHIARKRSTSKHYHPNKDTRLVCIAGSIRVRLWRDGEIWSDDILTPLEYRAIPKGIIHQTECVGDSEIYPPSENGAWLIEIEEPSDKSDLIRAEDAYGREGQPYETDAVPYTGELLKLSKQPSRFMGYELQITQAYTREAFCLPVGDQFITIRRDSTVKVSDYVADFISNLGIRHVFGVCGGGSMHLDDSFGHHPKLQFVATHHEQGAAMAAEAYARLNGLGCALVTTGPGGTNALTGVACAWVDSIPVIFLSGQVTSDTLLESTGLRQYGVQETDIVSLVEPITKHAITVRHAEDIRFELERAVFLAQFDRPGPVWIDIPLDVQSKRIDPSAVLSFDAGRAALPAAYAYGMEPCLQLLREAKRPVLIAGNGIRLAGADAEFRKLVDVLGIPVVTSWAAADMLWSAHPHHIGHSGIFGDRASNFAVQNADLLLVIGCRLSVPQMGYVGKTFAREAKIIMVDIDMREFTKPSLRVDLGIRSDAKAFLHALLSKLDGWSLQRAAAWHNGLPDWWLVRCQQWKAKYPVISPEYARSTVGVNSYHFVDELSKHLRHDAVVVVDTGASFTCTFQAAMMKFGQRWINDFGHAAMGYALPASVGAAFATGRKVVCLVGDGGLQMNIQEFATIAHHKLPIVIFVFSNGGYLTMQHTFQNHFGRNTGVDSDSGISFPYLEYIANAYGIGRSYIGCYDNLDAGIEEVLLKNEPWICEIGMAYNQPLIPRSSSFKRPDGSITSKPLEDMFPFLPRDEFKANMIVPTLEPLE